MPYSTSFLPDSSINAGLKEKLFNKGGPTKPLQLEFDIYNNTTTNEKIHYHLQSLIVCSFQ